MTTSTTSTVPHDIDALYPLAAEQVSAYRKQGFVRLPHVLTAETVGRYEPEITGKVVELNTQHLPMAERSTYQKAFLQIENLWPHSPLVRELVFSRRLAAIAADLMGVLGVRLYHDQALYKEASGGITPWHADHYYWPLDSGRTVTAWVPLQAVPAGLLRGQCPLRSRHGELPQRLDLPPSRGEPYRHATTGHDDDLHRR